MKPFATDLLLAVGGFIGLLLMMLGAWLAGWTGGDMHSLGLTMKSLGLFVLTGLLLFGAFVRADLDKHVRLAMILGAAFLIGTVDFWG